MFRSLRWRLTGWYMLILAGVLLLFSVGIYAAVYKLLLGNFDDVLRQQARLVAQMVDLTNSDVTLDAAITLPGRHDNEHFTRLYRSDGTLSFADNRDRTLPLLVNEVNGALAGENEFTQFRGAKGDMRVGTFPISRAGQVVGVLQLGVSLEDVSDTMRILLKVLLVLGPLVLLLASGSGLFLADRALGPIDRITRTAQRISAENLSGRIQLQGPADEVGRLARTFDAMLARLEAAFVRQRQFTADASHELRTPLTAIIGQIDVALEQSRSDASYRATLVSVREQAQRLTRLAGDLLLLARADSPSAQPAIEQFDMAAVLPAIVAQVAPLAAARDQAVVLNPLPPLLLCGNEDQLIRLVLNLLDNALRYTPSGGRIAVSGACAGREITISVNDSGPGIAPEHLPRLFDRFFRIDRVRNRAQGGSGLGLAIAQSIAQAHGGRIDVESLIGQGSTFTVVLPQARGAEGAHASA
jgi:heavy metal sensor kinase